MILLYKDQAEYNFDIYCNILFLGVADETIKKVKQAKERERNQKSLAQKRSELLLDEPIVPNIANIESKLKNIMIPKERTEDQTRIDGMRKRSRRTPGKVSAIINCYLMNTLYPILL